jgi:hypothetical protein
VRQLGFVLLLCVSVDFSNPMLPGTVRLDPGESVDAVYRGSPGHDSVPSPVQARQPDRPALQERLGLVRSGFTRLVLPERRWLLPARGLRPQPDDLTTPFPSEDH